MNLGSIITGILGLIFGKKNWEDWKMSDTSSEETYTDFGAAGNDAMAKYLGTRLTTAEREANAWSAQREDIAWNRQMEAANTSYQRSVADMQAAGINPMMAAGRSGGAAVPSVSPSSSVTPANGGNIFSDLMSWVFRSKEMKLQEKALESEIAKNSADVELKKSQADKNVAETAGTNLDNEVKALTKDARIEAVGLQNQLNRGNIALVQSRCDEIASIIRKQAQDISESVARSAYYEAAELASKATAYQITELLPYEKAYKSAATENQKSAALLAAANAAYQNHLIDDGYLDAFISKAKSEAGSAEAKVELDNIKSAIRTGDYSKVKHSHSLSGDVLSTVAILLDNFNPLNGLFK